MSTVIRVRTGGDRRIRIEVGADASVTITTGPSGVSVRVAENPDTADVDLISRYYSGRAMAKRSRFLRTRPGVSPAMEAAAVRSFLGGADVVRLGQSLAAVYEAMEAARLGRDDA